MHYYKKNLGDYAKKAGRLTILQHGVYNLLMDACYDREDFPTREQAIDWVWATTDEEIAALDFVLAKFFEDRDGVFVQTRIEEEIDKYREFCDKQAKRGASGGRPKKPGGFPAATTRDAEKSLTTNHKPITNNQVTTSSNKFSDADLGLAKQIFEKVRRVSPKSKEPNYDKWADDIRLMREQDGHSPEEIWSVFLFANSDSFWSVNILSTKKLREKFPSLHSKMINGAAYGTHREGDRQYKSASQLADEAAIAALERLQ